MSRYHLVLLTVLSIAAAPLPARLDGQLTFVSAAGGLRYVVVQIAVNLPPLRTIAILGHERQHANEIAEQPAIVDQASLAIAYGRMRPPATECSGSGPRS